VKGISFNVSEGEFFGFLGRTVLVRAPLSNSHYYSSKDLRFRIRRGLRCRKGCCQDKEDYRSSDQDTVVDEDLTGRENMILQGELQQMHGQTLRDRIDELLKIVDLVGAADKRAGFYSGGMKKRLDLATTLVHDPKILFLDEPTTGLDPQSRAAIWAYLKQLNEQGITIFITTQYLEEVDGCVVALQSLTLER